MSFNLNSLVRNNIRNLKPYTSARDEYKGKEGVFLDANENAFGSVTSELHNRYPDPLQWEVKYGLEKIKGVSVQNIFLGNGSDEPIDLLYRCFCNPGIDNVIITPPTYGMYEVSANINDVAVQKVNLTNDYQLNVNEIIEAINSKTKLIFLCSPNNPTGNCLDNNDITKIIEAFQGIVVVDEAYIDFAPDNSLLPVLNKYANLVVLQTFSKAWGMANLRLGMAFASQEIIQLFNKVKPPYNINGLTQKIVLDALKNVSKKDAFVDDILKSKNQLIKELQKINIVQKIYPSDANFILVKTKDGKKIYDYLVENKVIVRDRSNVSLCEGCLRITVGTPDENQILINYLMKY
ncbi:MAG: histidinol-phosphate transaminase [Bacteroidota bacterium]|nr:histidinol-phosphate transaminase [Bacteroidota bacterium]